MVAPVHGARPDGLHHQPRAGHRRAVVRPRRHHRATGHAGMGRRRHGLGSRGPSAAWHSELHVSGVALPRSHGAAACGLGLAIAAQLTKKASELTTTKGRRSMKNACSTAAVILLLAV